LLPDIIDELIDVTADGFARAVERCIVGSAGRGDAHE
jgi:hypothetical protein